MIAEASKIDFNFEALNSKYWNQLINSKVDINEDISESINEINYVEFLYWNKIKILSFINSKFKIVKFYFKKIIKKLNNFL